MPKKNISKLDLIITISLSIILFLVPMIFATNKDYYIYKMYGILACGVILLITLPFKFKKIKPDLTDILVLLYGATVIISTIFSFNALGSLLGAIYRHEGTIVILTYLLIYFHAKYSFKKYKYFEIISIIAYCAICILAIVQYYLPIKIQFFPIFGRGSCGTFGNTNFMGSFVSLVLPFFILKYITTNEKKYLLASILAFSAMIMCIARSSWVAFAIYSIMILIFIIINRNKSYIKNFIITAITFSICFAFITNVKFTSNPKSNPNDFSAKVTRIKNEVDNIKKEGVTNKTGSGRIEIWKMSFEVVKKFPLTGCGVDLLEYGLSLTNYELNEKYTKQHYGYIDKAHNEYLQIAATMGIPAIIIYLAFLASIILPNIKKMWKDEKLMLLITIIISYMAQAFFNISTISIAPIFWFVLGIAARYTKIEIKKSPK